MQSHGWQAFLDHCAVGLMRGSVLRDPCSSAAGTCYHAGVLTTQAHAFSWPCLQEFFVQAVEEAKELLDRRQGVQPATDYHPVDFLDPATWPDDMGLDPNVLLLPDKAQPGDVQLASAGDCLTWLSLFAAKPFCDTGVRCSTGPGPRPGHRHQRHWRRQQQRMLLAPSTAAADTASCSCRTLACCCCAQMLWQKPSIVAHHP